MVTVTFYPNVNSLREGVLRAWRGKTGWTSNEVLLHVQLTLTSSPEYYPRVEEIAPDRAVISCEGSHFFSGYSRCAFAYEGEGANRAIAFIGVWAASRIDECSDQVKEALAARPL